MVQAQNIKIMWGKYQMVASRRLGGLAQNHDTLEVRTCSTLQRPTWTNFIFLWLKPLALDVRTMSHPYLTAWTSLSSSSHVKSGELTLGMPEQESAWFEFMNSAHGSARVPVPCWFGGSLRYASILLQWYVSWTLFPRRLNRILLSGTIDEMVMTSSWMIIIITKPCVPTLERLPSYQYGKLI
jgi:hypothetical protein